MNTVTDNELFNALFDDEIRYQAFMALGFHWSTAALLTMGTNGV